MVKKVNKLITSLAKWWRQFKCRNDMHDHHDSAGMEGPIHFHVYRCKHCGSKFSI